MSAKLCQTRVLQSSPNKLRHLVGYECMDVLYCTMQNGELHA